MRAYGLPSLSPRRAAPYLLMGLMALCALAACMWTTQEIAAAYGYHPALGRPLHGHIYAPWSWWLWSQRIPDTYGVIDEAVSQGQMVFLGPMMIVIGLALQFGRRPERRDGIHGTAQWATKDDIERTGLLGKAGVYVGGWMDGKGQRYLRHNGPEHVLAFAPTRSGKGVGLVLPTLLSWGESTVVLDIKGENWALTAGWRQSQGHKVIRFDPTALGDGGRFNPLLEVRLDGPRAIPDAQNVAVMIVDPDGKGLKDYWNKAAFSFFAGAVLHCMIMVRVKHGRDATLYDLSCTLADEDSTIEELFREMLDTDHAQLLVNIFGPEEGGADYAAVHTFAATAAREMLNKAGPEMSGVVSTAVANMAVYRDPVVAKNIGTSDFRVSDLMNHDTPVSLYLVVSPADLNRLRPLIRLMLNVILRRLTERMEFEDGAAKAIYRHRLLLMLDEFPSLGNLEIFESSLAFMASYGLKAFLIVQDIPQLQKAYSKEESIISNCHIRTAYAPNKIETARVLSDMLGKTTVVERKTTLSGSRSGHLGRASVSMTETARALLTPDECMRLPGPVKNASGDRILTPGDMLVFAAGFPPIYGRQILYFHDPVFSRRARIPAPAASDRIASGAATAGAAGPETAGHPGKTRFEQVLRALEAGGDQA